MARQSLLLLVSVFALGGCVTLGPDYSRPEPPLDDTKAWREPSPAGNFPDVRWWAAFADPELEALITRALTQNQDLALAAARLEEARALAGLRKAERLPEVGVRAGVSRDESVSGFGGLSGEQSSTLEGERRILSATIAWELDLFGRLRRGEEAARAELLASEAALRSVELAVSSEVARAWFERTSVAHELELFRSALEGRREAVELQRLRFEAGVVAGVDLDRAEAELAATTAALPQLELAARRVENRLATLLGSSPSALALPPVPERLVEPPTVPAGLPSSLLDRRGDLLAAEQRLAAATARIGVTKAEILPRLSLTGAFGRESLELGNFVSASGTVWSFGADLVGSILGFGRGQARVAAAEARSLQALAIWRGAVLAALREVEDALVARRTQLERAAALEHRAIVLERAVAAERARYEAGETSYVELLEAERGELFARSEAMVARRAALVATVDLIQALGGGWPGELDG